MIAIKRTFICIVTLAVGLVAQTTVQAATEIKIATLAPRGSTWEQVFKYISRDVDKLTESRIKVKLYPGGVQGDERVVIDKIKVGQLQGGGITAVGMSLLVPEALIFQLPRLFNSTEELDYVRDKLTPDIDKLFREKGFVLAGWSDVGDVFFYSEHPIKAPADLAKGGMWVWNIDPMFDSMARIAGASPVPLGVPDVLPSLNTGQIQTVYGSPLSVLSLQWWTKVKYVTSQPIQTGVGAIVLSEDALKAIDPSDRKIVEDANRKWLKRLLSKVREANAKSAAALKTNGIQTVEMSSSDANAWQDMADKVAVEMTGKIYPRPLLDKVQSLLREFRSK